MGSSCVRVARRRRRRPSFGTVCVRRVFGAFAASGLLCGCAGVLWGARFGTVNAFAANGLELQVIAAVVVGGVNIFGGSGTAFGAVLGAILLGTIDSSLTLLRLSQFWLQIGRAHV